MKNKQIISSLIITALLASSALTFATKVETAEVVDTLIDVPVSGNEINLDEIEFEDGKSEKDLSGSVHSSGLAPSKPIPTPVEKPVAPNPVITKDYQSDFDSLYEDFLDAKEKPMKPVEQSTSKEDYYEFNYEEMSGGGNFTPQDSTYVGGDNYSDFSGNDYNTSDAYDNYFLDIYDDESSPESSNEMNSSTRSKLTTSLQFTLDTNAKYINYIETGIRLPKGDSINAKDLQEALYQISILKKGKLIEDKDRYLVFLDKKVFVIDKSKNVNKDKLNTFLASMNIKVDILDTRLGGKFNLADYVEVNGDMTVSLDGKDVKLTIAPKVEDSRVLLPIRDIVENLGGSVEYNRETGVATIKKDSKVITYTKNEDFAVVNGSKIKLSATNYVDGEEERFFAVVKLLVSELDGNMEWNATDLKLVVNSNEYTRIQEEEEADNL